MWPSGPVTPRQLEALTRATVSRFAAEVAQILPPSTDPERNVLDIYTELVVRTHPYDALTVLRHGNREVIHDSSDPARAVGLRLEFAAGARLGEYELRMRARPPYVTARLATGFGGTGHESVRINAGPTGELFQLLTEHGDTRSAGPRECLDFLVPKHHAFFAVDGVAC